MENEVEVLLEGTYLYYKNNVNYSHENFKLVQALGTQQFHVYAEILTRVETGEFLKILIRYEMSHNYTPHFVKIEKSIGNKYAQEIYKYDAHTQELHYTFQGQTTHEFKKPHSAKHYLTSPAVSTSAMWYLSKKMDATGRTPVVLVGSSNEWTYQGPPTDKFVYAELKSRELSDFKLNNNTLPASHLCLYEHDSANSALDNPVEFYLSKYYAIPYQLVHGDHKMVIKNLKKTS